MTETLTATDLTLPPPFPDHTQLPESNGTFVFAWFDLLVIVRFALVLF